MLDVIWLIPAFPLAGFLAILVFGRRLGEPASGFLASGAVLASFVVSIGAYFDLLSHDERDRSHVESLFSWVPLDSLQIDMAFLADPLSITMCLFVTGIAFLIHLFAIGYMRGDPKFSKFFLYLNLFVLSMTVLVLGENLLVTFLGWEGVGTCSYLLISFWHTSDANATAGKKAFVTNRIGDWGFMLAMFLGFKAVGSVSYLALNDAAGGLSQNTATGIALFLFIGAIGKSAQLPLSVWLPDAMAGPTPVSALIHAATMVTAGVFLMTRMNPMLAAAAPEVSTLIAWVGAITALFAATIAVAQTDIKKVLAYSTVSQLGYMFLAVGSGAFVAAIFHMVTHAFFKALMFLGSGSVIHGMHHEQDMNKMGALGKVMPVTAVTFIVGWLAIAGVPPFAGFWSKDEILLFTLAKGGSGVFLYVIGLVTAVLTAYYMTRQVVLVFFGEARWGSHANDAEAAHLVGDGDGIDAEPSGETSADALDTPDTRGAHGEFKPHESPPIMLLPLVVLAALSFVGGVIQLPSFGFIPSDARHKLEDWLHPVVEIGEARITDTSAYDAKELLALLAIACALAGIAAAVAIYVKKLARPVEPRLLAEGWKYDTAISAFMGGPGRRAFEAIAWFDQHVIDGAVNGAARVVDVTGTGVRKVQTGNVRNYAGIVGVGVVLLLAWFVIGRGVL